jgi:DNA-binding MarR family transcriptional regulator
VDAVHFTFFALKRTFLQAMHKVQVPMMHRLALTPARFDLMFVLQRLRGDAGMRQSTISCWLGVSRQAVSKMVIVLEKLGFVRRKRPNPKKPSRVYVLLTKVGRVVLRRAIKKLAVRDGAGPAERAARTIFLKRWWSKPCTRMEFRRTETYFTRLRTILDDRATLHYDWDPARKIRYLAYRRDPPRPNIPPSPPEAWRCPLDINNFDTSLFLATSKPVG